MNLQINYLPALFRSNSVSHIPRVNQIEQQQWIEFISYYSKYSERDIPGTLDQLTAMLDSESNPKNKAVILAGIGRCQIRAGHFLDGARTLGHAYDTIDGECGDVKAFVLLEMVSFLGNIDQHDQALSLLEKIPGLTNQKYLLKIAAYYHLVQRSRISDLTVVDDLLKSADYFQEIEEYSTLAYHYKNIGNIFRKYKDYSSAESYYDKSSKLAAQNEFDHIVLAVDHDRGMLRFHQGEFDAAIGILNQTQLKAESIYTRAHSLANMGFLYLSRSDIPNAAQYFQKAFNIASESGVFHLLPGTSYYLAACYQKLDQIDLAKYFYEKGFQAANELLEHGFKYSGDRQKAILGYVEFLKIHSDSSQVDIDPDYSFAVDKTLKEIRSIFQSALFGYINRKTTTNKDAIAMLGISNKSYYLIRDRIKHLNGHKPPEDVLKFIQQSDISNWQDLNRRFDSVIVNYLYHEYGRSRKELSSRLGVSYASITQLMNRTDQQLVFTKNNQE